MSIMINSIVRLSLVLLVYNVIVVSCEDFRNKGNYETKYETRGYSMDLAKQLASLSSTSLENLGTHRGIGLSAWGIVMVTIAIMLAIAGMYYFSICYPVLCQKPRKFDSMESPIV